MKFRKLGKTGLEVSEIGFGAWAIGGGWGPQEDADSLAALNRAIDMGLNFIDTAAGYGDGRSERLIGQVLKNRKEKVWVATKTPPMSGWWPPSPYDKVEDRYPEKYLRENVETRLKNLGVDTIDVLQLHTWVRAWNKNPKPFEVLKKLQSEGKIRYIGVSTPEPDQDCVNDLMRGGWVDTVQLIYNIFEQDVAAELLPLAQECNVGIIVRVVFDEGALTGKFTADTKFAEGDFRNRYFAGDRLQRAVQRADKLKQDFAYTGLSLPDLALKFALAHPAVSTVIPGIRNIKQAEANIGVSDGKPLADDVVTKLHEYVWRRGSFYSAK